MTTELELFSVSVNIVDRVADYRRAGLGKPAFLHVSMPFHARYGMPIYLCGLGVQVDPQLKGLAFYLRREPT